MGTNIHVNSAGREASGEGQGSDIINLPALFALLISNWKFLLSVVVAGGVITALIVVILPNTYTATALILPPAKPQSLSSVLMGQFSGMAGALAPSLGLKDPADMYIGILRSRTTNDDLVAEFGLKQVYSSATKEDARRKLVSRASFTSGKDAMIRISVEDRDPHRAAALANAFITELNRQNNRIALTESSQRRLFFERQVAVEKEEVAAAESALKQTQQRTGLVEIGNQAQVVISSIARLRSEVTMEQVSLERLKMGATTENPEIARREAELSALRSQLRKLEAGSTRQSSGDPLIPVANVPQAGLEYLRAVRDVKYHEALFEVLAKQYEAARIDEAKDVPVIQVVDSAIPPEKKSGPARTQITVLSAVFFGILGALFIYFFRSEPVKASSTLTTWEPRH